MTILFSSLLEAVKISVRSFNRSHGLIASLKHSLSLRRSPEHPFLFVTSFEHQVQQASLSKVFVSKDPQQDFNISEYTQTNTFKAQD